MSALHQDSRSRHAELTGERRNCGHQQRDGGVEIGVVKDDHRRLTAEFEVHPLERRRAGSGDHSPNCGASCVADHLDVR